MAIEFHCEHCNHLIRATESEAGRMGVCPHCKGRNYVPRAEAELGEIPLAPLDETEELRRQRSAQEDAALQMKLLKERARDRDMAGKPAFKRPDGLPTESAASTPSGGRASTSDSGVYSTGSSKKHLAGLIVSYVESMCSANLEKAEKLASQLGAERRLAAILIDEMLTEDLTGYGMPALPRPVLLGFLKQLRGRL
ncbi:MAG: hypothetical protein KF841_09155 [Phycisphaerae bacterium]|nr:hypothetical protein [Phycisphaerae bacterium]